MLKPKQNTFLDTILGKFATRIGLMDSIVNVVWNEQDRSALIHMRPVDPEKFEEIKDLLVETLREIDSVKFKSRAQEVKYRGQPAIVLMVKESQ